MGADRKGLANIACGSSKIDTGLDIKGDGQKKTGGPFGARLLSCLMF